MFDALDKAAQLNAYNKFRIFCDDNFDFREETQKYRFYRDARQNINTSNYGFSIYNAENTFGISLDGFDFAPTADAMRIVLKFATYSHASGAGKTAAILARNGHGRIALFHNGRTYTADGRGTPSLGKTASIAGKLYYFVSYLDDLKFLSHLIAFHQSRKNIVKTKTSVPRKKDACDLGNKNGGIRKEVCFEAKHHPVALALTDALRIKGWNVSKVSSVSPDLVVEKNGKKILFEVKPSGNSHDLMVGLSQLIIYNRFVNADKICLVAGSPSRNALAVAISEYMLEENIEFLQYSLDGDMYGFHELQALIA